MLFAISRSNELNKIVYIAERKTIWYFATRSARSTNNYSFEKFGCNVENFDRANHKKVLVLHNCWFGRFRRHGFDTR